MKSKALYCYIWGMDYRSFRKQDFKFWTNLNMRWVDMDSLGHINNAVYLNYFETARVDFFSKN